MMSKSKLKMWLKKNGFICPKFRRTPRVWTVKRPCVISTPFRECLQYGGHTFARNGRFFRVRSNEHEFVGGEKRWTVDISLPREFFDRWAVSTEVHAMPIEMFIEKYSK